MESVSIEDYQDPKPRDLLFLDGQIEILKRELKALEGTRGELVELILANNEVGVSVDGFAITYKEGRKKPRTVRTKEFFETNEDLFKAAIESGEFEITHTQAKKIAGEAILKNYLNPEERYDGKYIAERTG